MLVLVKKNVLGRTYLKYLKLTSNNIIVLIVLICCVEWDSWNEDHKYVLVGGWWWLNSLESAWDTWPFKDESSADSRSTVGIPKSGKFSNFVLIADNLTNRSPISENIKEKRKPLNASSIIFAKDGHM